MRLPKHDMKSSNDVETDVEGEASETTSLLRGDSDSRVASAGAVGREHVDRSLSGAGKDGGRPRLIQHAKTSADIRQQFKHLGPSNAASRPRATKYTAVKIKPGNAIEVVNAPKSAGLPSSHHGLDTQNEASSLVDNSNASKPSRPGYGTVTDNAEARPSSSINVEAEPKLEARLDAKLEELSASPKTAAEASAQAASNVEPQSPAQTLTAATPQTKNGEVAIVEADSESDTIKPGSSRDRHNSNRLSPAHSNHHSRDRPSHASSISGVKTGGIVENVVDVGGLKKVVLEANGSSTSLVTPASGSNDDMEDNEDTVDRNKSVDSTASSTDAGSGGAAGEGADKKKKKKRGGKKGKKH